MNLRKDFGLLNIVKTLIDYGDFKSWTKCNLHYDTVKSYRNQGLESINLNVIDTDNLKGRGTVRRDGFVGVDMTLLKEVCHCSDRL